MSKTILAVEDDDSVRGMVRSILAARGFEVLEAADADAALEVFQAHAAQVDLVFTDILMPGSMNGLELGRRLSAENEALKVVYTSGSNLEQFAGGDELEEGVNYLAKPYRGTKLRNIIEQALGEQTAA